MVGLPRFAAWRVALPCQHGNAFILRGVSLLGIDSVQCPAAKRRAAWEQIVALLPESYYQEACHEITLEQVPEAAAQIVKGEISGRTLIKVG